MEYISWCGGGEISPTPGVEWRVCAIQGYTLRPGSCPPSPGFAPCALYLKFPGMYKIIAGHTEPAGSYLLDSTVL